MDEQNAVCQNARTSYFRARYVLFRLVCLYPLTLYFDPYPDAP